MENNVTPKNLPNFMKALWDDITGKDANGRDAAFKEWYSNTLLWVIGGVALISIFVHPAITVGLGVIWARKFYLHLRNTF